MKLTIKDIAKMAGVSTTTVSLILNDKADRFNENTVEKVMKVVREHNYQPNFFARNMITKNTQTIGVILPDIKDYFFNQLFEGIETFFKQHNYGVVLYRTSHSKEQEEKAINFMLSRSVSGIIFATPYLFDKDKYHDLQKNCPVMLLDRGRMERDKGKYYVDEYQGARDLMDYLYQQGHRKIALIKENKDYYQLTERTKAYYDALKSYELPVNDALVQTTSLNVEGGYLAMEELLKKDQDFTAVVCTNDYLALGAYRALQLKGYKIPTDVSVVGFDNIDLSQYLTPSLTTVAQPIFEMGNTVAEMLLHRIENPDTQLENKIFKSQLVIRESVRKL